MAEAARKRRELACVAEWMPRNTKAVKCGGAEGYLYEIKDNFEQVYRFFMFYDAGRNVYQVLRHAPTCLPSLSCRPRLRR
jgi:hypothetical protein